jgi:phage-related protein (TIGR01555 family)
MGRPAGSKNKPKQQQSSEIVRTDDYAQAFTGAGTRSDRSTYTRPQSAMLMWEGVLSDLYIGDGFARTIVDIPAEEMTRAGVYIDDADDKLKNTIESRLQELDAMKHFNDAVRWSRLFGGSIVVMGLNDGGKLDAPLNPNGIRKVEFLRVYDRFQATVQTRYDDPEFEKYGQPLTWLITPRLGGMPYIVHESRCLVFDGEALPDLSRVANLGWGASVLQGCYDQLKRLGMSHQWTNMILERAQQAVHGIPNLGELLRSRDGEAAVRKRLEVVDMVRGILNTVAIDSAESYDIKTTSLSGIPDTLDRFAEALSATSRIPVYILMGRSKGGLSNGDTTGEAAWYARIESMQNDILRKPVDTLLTYLMIEGGFDSSEYKLCFHPLIVKSEKEVAEVDKINAEAKRIKAEADNLYVTMGAIDPNEVRSCLEDEYDISGDMIVTPDDISKVVTDGL